MDEVVKFLEIRKADVGRVDPLMFGGISQLYRDTTQLTETRESLLTGKYRRGTYPNAAAIASEEM